QMMAGDRSAIARVVSDLARRSDLQWVGVLDRHGRIQVSSDPGVVGQIVDPASPECRICHDTASPPESFSATVFRPDKAVFRTVTPIRNHGKCHGCHGAEPKLNGLLVMDRPASPLEAAVQNSRTQVLAGSAAALIALVASLWFAVDSVVLGRLRRLHRAARMLADDAGDSVSNGGAPAGYPVLSRDLNDMAGSSGDEVGTLARAFERMVGGLARQRAQIRERDEERTRLLKRLISSQEDERARIARELHDELAQTISALNLMVHSAGGEGAEGAEDRRAMVAQIAASIDQIRRMAWRLRPSILDDYGLKKALERHIQEVSGNAACELVFKFVADEGLDERLDAAVELALYRVAQEAIANVLKHAGARRASVLLYRRRENATLIIEDDGKGFDPGGRVPSDGPGGLGIVGMRERAALLGGEVVIESSPGRGTMLRATMPLGGPT
ncbi:MAG: HAMP domain-containing protein, partial [Deltaproteobacteria bacterium]|nr:HAMP domain-containing protein [Deltaproteobacteria bacterium]